MNSSTNAASAQAVRVEPPLVRKFMFERSFADAVRLATSELEPPPAVYTEAEMEATHCQAYESGYTEGQKSMADDQRQLMNALLSQLNQRLGQVTETGSQQWQEQIVAMQDVALAIVRKVLPTYVAQHGLEEIKSIVAQVMSEVAREPRLVLRVNEEQFDVVNLKIKEVAERQAYAGKIIVLAEPDLGPADCRVEWADGGIERDVRSLWQHIDRVMGKTPSLAGETQ